ESFAILFLQGRVTEADMTHDDVLNVKDMRECRYLYISGLASRNADSYSGKENAAILLWGLLKYLEHFYGVARPLAFASAVTEEGDELLRKFKLDIACPADTRADRHTMYKLRLTSNEISRRLDCLPSYASLCALDWACH